MEKCRNNCGNELTSYQKHFCSDKCRLQYKHKFQQPEPEQERMVKNTYEAQKVKIDSERI